MLPTLRRQPMNPFEELQREIDRAFDRAWPGDDGGMQMGNYPVDVYEQDDHLVVEAELPGFKREEIDVTFEQGVLTISAVRKPQESPGQAHLRERRFTRVTRSFRLGTAIDDHKVKATLVDGVLRLELPKREEVRPRKIEVK